MARKQTKKRTFGHAPAVISHTQSVTALTPSGTSTASKAPVPADYSRYTYVKKDLRQIAVILIVILTLYAGIFLADQSLHLF